MQKNYQHLWRVERDVKNFAFVLKYWDKQNDTIWEDVLKLDYEADGKFLKWLDWALNYILCCYRDYISVVMSKIQDKSCMENLIKLYKKSEDDIFEDFLESLSKS